MFGCTMRQLAILLVYVLYACRAQKNGLLTVSVIFRHGDRTPEKPYATDPYKDPSCWPVGFGQLTNLGKMQHFKMGQWLRDRYDYFLTDLYLPRDIRITSTDMDRTLMSAESNLAGLFPPVRTQVWNNHLEWQPIPIHTAPIELDSLLAMHTPCRRYNVLLEQLRETPRFVDYKRRNGELYAYLSKHSGNNINDFEGAEKLYNTLWIENLYNKTLPTWTDAVFPDRLRPIADFSFATSTFTPELARLKIGPLVNRIAEQLTNDGLRAKFAVYSAHDTTIANVLNGLGIFEYHCPPYTATILIEQRLIADRPYVNILYKNSTLPRKMVLKGCQFDCPLEKFLEIIGPLRITEQQWRHECSLSFGEAVDAYVSAGGYGVVGALIVCTVSVMCVAMYIVLRRRKQKEYVVLSSQDEGNNLA